MSLANDAPRFRAGVILALFVMVAAPALLVIYQSVLDAPFFDDNVHFSLGAFRFVLSDPEFYRAFWTTTLYAFGVVAVAFPLGGLLAFLITRTDLKGRTWLVPIVLVPMFLSSIVLAFGYTVSVGPSGFVTIAFRSLFGSAPWSIYTLPSIILIGGLSHVPTVYLYVASAMRRLKLTEQLTLANFKAVFEIPSLSRGILNTILLAGVGARSLSLSIGSSASPGIAIAARAEPCSTIPC